MLPAAVRMAVVAAGRAAHTDLDVGRELAPPVPDDATVHRFDPAAASGDRVAAVLAGLPARRLAGCTLYLTWRSTPAGAAPGPVPRAVVLVEAGPDRSADVLAYLLATELDRAAVPASVEVFTTGTTLPAYHRAALAAARRIEVGASVIAPAGVVVARTAAEAAARAAVRPAVAWRHPHPSIRRPPRAVRSRRCPPTRGPGRPPAGRSRPRAGRTRRRCSWCPRRTRSPRCRARRAAPHGDAGRRPAGWRSRRSPVVRRRPEPVRRTAGERRSGRRSPERRSHRCRTCGRRARHRPVPRPTAGSAAGAAARSHGPGSRRTGLPASGPHPDPSRARAAGDRPNPGGCAGGRIGRGHVPDRARRDSSRPLRRAGRPTFRPWIGQRRADGHRARRSGRRAATAHRRPAVRHDPAGHGRRGGGCAGCAERIRAGRARLGRLGRRAAGVGGRLAVG